MCSQMDDPTQHDKVTRPRVYELSGQGPRGSVALAVIGEMLNEAEKQSGDPFVGSYADERAEVLREARDRVAAAEAAQ